MLVLVFFSTGRLGRGERRRRRRHVQDAPLGGRVLLSELHRPREGCHSCEYGRRMCIDMKNLSLSFFIFYNLKEKNYRLLYYIDSDLYSIFCLSLSLHPAQLLLCGPLRSTIFLCTWIYIYTMCFCCVVVSLVLVLLCRFFVTPMRCFSICPCLFQFHLSSRFFYFQLHCFFLIFDTARKNRLRNWWFRYLVQPKSVSFFLA